MPEDDSSASQVPQDEPSVNKVNNNFCKHPDCKEAPTHMCRECAQEFCDKHQCLMHSLDRLQMQDEPLIDDEGVERRGRRIRLIGEGWPNHIEMLVTMSEDQLAAHIEELQKLLRASIEATDFCRISIAHAEFQLEYKKHSRYVAAVKRREKIEQGVIRLGKKRAKAQSAPPQYLHEGKPVPADVASLMTAFKLPYEQALAMKILLGGQKKS